MALCTNYHPSDPGWPGPSPNLHGAGANAESFTVFANNQITDEEGNLFFDVGRDGSGDDCPNCWYVEYTPFANFSISGELSTTTYILYSLPNGITVDRVVVVGGGNNYLRFKGSPTGTGMSGFGRYAIYVGRNCTGTITKGTLLVTGTVNPQPVPVITNTAPNAHKGDLYFHQVLISAQYAWLPILNPVFTITNLPPGIAHGNGAAIGTGFISGTPTTVNLTGTSITIKVTCTNNSIGTVVNQTIIIWEAAPEIIITVPFSTTGNVTDPSTPILPFPVITKHDATHSLATSFSLGSGTNSVPAGITINSSTGEISGSVSGEINCSQTSVQFYVYATNQTGGPNGTPITVISGAEFALILSERRTPIILSFDYDIPQILPKIYYNELMPVAPNRTVSTTVSRCPTRTTATGVPAGVTFTDSITTVGLSGTPTAPGQYTVNLAALGQNGLTSTGTLKFFARYHAPVITNANPQEQCEVQLDAVVGFAFSRTLTATNSPILFNHVSGTLPTGFTLTSATGVISALASHGATPGSYTIGVQATNFGLFGTVPADTLEPASIITINVYATVAETAPQIADKVGFLLTDETEADAIRGEAFSFEPTLLSHCPVSWSATSLPTGLTINTTTGVISGTPTAVGFFDSTINATNQYGAVGTKVMSFIVTYPPAEVTSPLVTFAERGIVFDPPTAYGGTGAGAGYQITTTQPSPLADPAADIFGYVADGLLEGLTLDNDSSSPTFGLISGTVDSSVQSGQYTILISASNAEAYSRVPVPGGGPEEIVPHFLDIPIAELIIKVYNPAPTITSVTPNTASPSGGVEITITGTGFLGPVTIFIGNVSFIINIVTTITVSDTELTFTLPALPFIDEPYDVVVINTDGQAAISEDAITIAPNGVDTIDFLRYTSLYTDRFPIYEVESTGGSSQRKDRIFGLGTNVEVMYYNGKDTANNKLLNVYRKQLGTTSTRHAGGDLVFNGILSLQAAPFMLKTESGYVGEAVCYIRSDGKIRLGTKSSEEGEFTVNTKYAYASYQALLIKSITPLNKINVEECE